MNRVREKIRVIEESIQKIDENLPNDYKAFKSQGIQKDGVYRNVEVAIQACFDICALIVKEEKLRVPGEEESMPDILVEEDILTEKVGSKLKNMKGFRNALAHRYGEINDEVAYENISRGISDFQVFLDEIDDYLEE